MPRYERDFITQVLARADFVTGTVPMGAQPPEAMLAAVEGWPERSVIPRTRTEVRMQRTPQGPVRDSRTISFPEYNFWTEGRMQHVGACSEYLFLSQRQYAGYASLREGFLELLDAVAGQYPGMRLRRLGLRYVNNIKLPEQDAGPGLGADFWEHYVNPLLLGGLRFAANDGAMARHLCTTELNYGTDRATIRYGIVNSDYPQPNRRREFVLDVDAYCQTVSGPETVPARLDDYHAAACQVFAAAVTDALRARMGRA